jgi:hypothetical protein
MSKFKHVDKKSRKLTRKQKLITQPQIKALQLEYEQGKISLPDFFRKADKLAKKLETPPAATQAVDNAKPIYCCDGTDCSCRGEPIAPPEAQEPKE